MNTLLNKVDIEIAEIPIKAMQNLGLFKAVVVRDRILTLDPGSINS